MLNILFSSLLKMLLMKKLWLFECFVSGVGCSVVFRLLYSMIMLRISCSRLVVEWFRYLSSIMLVMIDGRMLSVVVLIVC